MMRRGYQKFQPAVDRAEFLTVPALVIDSRAGSLSHARRQLNRGDPAAKSLMMSILFSIDWLSEVCNVLDSTTHSRELL